MEVEFPSSDDDSIYQSDHEIVLERPPLSPVGRPISGYAAKVLDEEMDIIEAEEMSSDEPDSGSDGSTEALSESLDPISDDDMVDIDNKDQMLTDYVVNKDQMASDDEQFVTKPDPTSVEVAGIVTPTTSDELATVNTIEKAAEDPETPEHPVLDNEVASSTSVSQAPTEILITHNPEQSEDMELMEVSSPAPPTPTEAEPAPVPATGVDVKEEQFEVVPESTDIVLVPETNTAEIRELQSAHLPEPEQDEQTEDEAFVDTVEYTSRASVSSSEEVLFRTKDGDNVLTEEAPMVAQRDIDSDTDAEAGISESGSRELQPETSVSEEKISERSEPDTPTKDMDVELGTNALSQPDVTSPKIETESTHSENPTPITVEAETNAILRNPHMEKDVTKSDPESAEEVESKVDEKMLLETEERTEREDPLDSDAETKFSDAPEDDGKEDPSGSSPEQEQPISFASKLASFGASVFGFGSSTIVERKEEEPEEVVKKIDVTEKELENEPEQNEADATKDKAVIEPAEDEPTSLALRDTTSTDDAMEETSETQADSNADKASSVSQSTDIADDSDLYKMEEEPKEAADVQTEEVEEPKDLVTEEEVVQPKGLESEKLVVQPKGLKTEEELVEAKRVEAEEEVVNPKALVSGEQAKGPKRTGTDDEVDEEVEETNGIETELGMEETKDMETEEKVVETRDMEIEEDIKETKDMTSAEEVLRSAEVLTKSDSINVTVAPATVELETNKAVFQGVDPKSPKLSSEVARQMELSNTSLDVPDVEDISDGKASTDAKQRLTAAGSSGDLVDIDVSKREADDGANDSTDRTPEFPEMDEIQIGKPSNESDSKKATGVDSSNKSLSIPMREVKDEFGADTVVDEELTPKDAEATSTSKSPPTSPSKQGMPSSRSFKKGGGGFIFGMSSFYRAFRKSSKTKEKENDKELNEDSNIRETIVSARRADSDISHKSKPKERKRKTFSGKEAPRKSKEKDQEQSVSDLGNSSVRDSIAASESDSYLEMRTPEEKAEEERHLRLEETLKSQIATLRSARSGFVDLALLTPMTEKTLAAVEFEAKRILSTLPEVETRKETLSRQVELLEMTTEAELMAKEKTLVAAKIKVAEAKCELDKLRHELFILNREIAEPKRALAQQRLRLKVRREKANKELGAAMESKETMQRNLDQRKAMLENYQAEVSRLQKSVQDLEGDWS